MDKANKLYSIKELEEVLPVKEITIRRWIASGKLRTVRIGNKHFIKESTISDILENGIN